MQNSSISPLGNIFNFGSPIQININFSLSFFLLDKKSLKQPYSICKLERFWTTILDHRVHCTVFEWAQSIKNAKIKQKNNDDKKECQIQA